MTKLDKKKKIENNNALDYTRVVPKVSEKFVLCLSLSCSIMIIELMRQMFFVIVRRQPIHFSKLNYTQDPSFVTTHWNCQTGAKNDIMKIFGLYLETGNSTL